MRVLVTGASGYVGRAVVSALQRAGHTPVGLVRKHVHDLQAEVHVGDVLDPSTLVGAVQGIDVVCHLAGLTRARDSWDEAPRYFQVNAAGTANLLAVMADHDVRRLVLASTGGIYGSPDEQPMTEGLPDAIPHPYAASKRAAELAAEWQVRTGRLAAAVLRLFNVAGGHDPDRARLVPRVLAAASGAQPFEVNGDGTAVRDILHLDDAAAAFVAACEHMPAMGTSRRFNIGSGIGVSVLELLEAARRVTNCHIEVVHRPPADEPARLIADPSRAEAELGWKAQAPSIDQVIADAWALERQP